MTVPLVLGTLLGLLSCREAPTQLVLVVDTDYRVPSELGAVAVRAYDSSGSVVTSAELVLAERGRGATAGSVSIPFSFGVAPLGADASRRVVIELDGERALGGEILVRRRIATGFVKHQKRLLHVFLSRACEGVWMSCALGETCVEGGVCRVDDVAVDSLPEVRPGDEFRSTGADGDVDAAGEHDATEERDGDDRDAGTEANDVVVVDAGCMVSHCVDGETLRVCDGAGGATDVTCNWGCSGSGGAHCARFFPAGGAVDMADLTPNASLATVALTSTALDSDTGQIDGVRPAGVGILGGIGFEARGSVGVFTFADLLVSSGTLSLRGRNAVALVSTGSIRIEGVIDARGDCVGTSAGPGGGLGGDVNQQGRGPGGGAGGRGIHDDASGGGGGANGASGGRGGAGASEPRSNGGAPFGDERISLLAGGSGGGGGGGVSGGPGGGGGGAVQLVANAVVVISSGGGINAGGCGGRGATSGAQNQDDGGGGGGAGGTILIEARAIEIAANAALAVNGGGGGGGDSNGADGEPGLLGAVGSNGGSGSGDGGDGGTRGALPGAPGENDQNGGGGGGGVGRIRLHTRTGSAAVEGAAILSPALGEPMTTTTQGRVDVR